MSTAIVTRGVNLVGRSDGEDKISALQSAWASMMSGLYNKQLSIGFSASSGSLVEITICS